MSGPFLTDERVESILTAIPRLRIAVVGDLYLDRYLELDPRLTEPSIETGLDAYQVVAVRASPGAAGTVINNLAALGVGSIHPLAMIGDDGEGYELRQALSRLGCVQLEGVLTCAERRTPTYTKPMLGERGELNRLDIHNRQVLPIAIETQILAMLETLWSQVDGIVVLDQVRLPDCGVVTSRVREKLAELGRRDPERWVLADSRERIRLFRGVMLKPNQQELGGRADPDDLRDAVRALAIETERAVFCTCGKDGIVLGTPEVIAVPGYAVTGPTDPVGAGDSTSAGIVCALASGASLAEAAAFGNLVASITVQQIGTTGTASPTQVRHRWRQVCG